jgi:regulatory protein
VRIEHRAASLADADAPMTDLDTTRELRQAALALLARREHSTFELARKLRTRGFSQSDLDPVLSSLQANGLLSDERFVEMFVRSRISRGQGPLKIRAELRERGIADGLIEAYLDDSAESWGTRAEEARAKRFGKEKPNDQREWGRQARFLGQRGFEGEVIRRLLRDGEP